MARFQITAPDGATYEIDAPEGATEEQAIQFLRGQMGGGEHEAPKLSPSAQKVKDVMDTVQGLPIVGGPFRALRDRSQAGAQLLARAFASPESVQAYEQVRQDSERKYQDARKAQGDEGIDWDRTIFGAATDALVASRIPGMKSPAPTMLGRAKQGAVMGATAGALTPAENADSGESFLGKKAVQVGGSAAIGAAAPFVLEPAIAGITKAVNSVAGRMKGAANGVTGRVASQNVEFNLALTLKQQGVDWNSLSADTKRSLVADVQKALLSGKPITADQISRAADFRALGMEPTRGQVTLDPMLFKTEQNLKGVANIGQPLTDRFTEQNQAIFARLGNLRAGAGGTADDLYDAGASVKGALDAANKSGQQRVRAAYDAAKGAAGMDAEVPLTPLAQKYGEMRGFIDDDLLPGAVKQRLAALGLNDGVQRRTFSLQDSEDLLKAINLNYDPRNVAQARVLDELKRAVREGVDAMGDGSGPAAELARTARQTAAERFRLLEGTPALAASKQGTLRPDDLIEKFVISKASSVDQLRNMVGELDEPAKANLKSAIVQHLSKKAQGTSPNGAPQFNYATFAQEVERIGARKLRTIFTPAEVADIERIVRVGAVMNFNPKSVTINRSGTSQAILDVLSRVNTIPFANRLIAGPIESAIKSGQVNAALNPSLSGVPGGVLSDALRAQIAERGGLLGAAAIAPAVPALLAQ